MPRDHWLTEDSSLAAKIYHRRRLSNLVTRRKISRTANEGVTAQPDMLIYFAMIKNGQYLREGENGTVRETEPRDFALPSFNEEETE